MFKILVKQLKIKKTVRAVYRVQPYKMAESEEKDYKEETGAYLNDSRCPPTDRTPQYHIHGYFGNFVRDPSRDPSRDSSSDSSRDSSRDSILQTDDKCNR